MSETLQNNPKLDPDPIIDEIHDIRRKLEEKHQGDLHSYSLAARAHAIALGFQVVDIDALGKR
jgi:hypothetical protein